MFPDHPLILEKTDCLFSEFDSFLHVIILSGDLLCGLFSYYCKTQTILGHIPFRSIHFNSGVTGLIISCTDKGFDTTICTSDLSISEIAFAI